ncbi:MULTISPECIES: hypothetical protein [Nesterenkonia]|uniref:Apolipoprotein N-acyltransferase n=1 Tax=Nesterenkonia xinjiangensis TaxID=225327 RepID=A0A7Z0GL78_9MICC|nr:MULTISPECIES: hypothetical protein [Nesterenkonia]MDZ5077423.1 hypothetical protein [Nesterenkonia sp. HG001]NYJ78056.1 apolipoprotein N-acyltransferase [Nesterenkonia xinjiangensis]
MEDLLLTVVFIVLLLNLVVAVITALRARRRGSWLLVILLSGTTGAALTAVLALTAEPPEPRMLDVGLILTGLAALTAAVRAARLRREEGKPHAPDQ